MSLMYFGSNGVYSLNDSTITAITSTNASMNTVYGGLLGGSYGGIVQHQDYGQLQNYFNQAQAMPQQQLASSTGSLSEFMGKLSSPAKAAKKHILAKLREEIDGWHNNVLERLVTA